MQKSLGQLREVERAASWPRRQPRQARSAQRQVLCGRLAGSPRDEARARRAPWDENETATTVRSRSRRPSAVSVQRSLGQLREVERAASWPRRQPRQARSAQRQVLCGRSAGSPRDEARARCAPRDENGTATTVRSRSRRPSAVSVQRSLGQLREVERAASWPRRQPRQARSTQRSWPRRQPRQARSAQSSVGGRLVLHVTKRARAARHGTRTRRQRRFEAVAADRARCRCRGASANCVRWSAPRVGRADNRAKHAARRDKCSVGGRLVLHVTKRARVARHGTRTRRQRRFEAVAADRARCRCRGASANYVRWSAPRVGREDNRAKHAAAGSWPRRQPRQARSAQMLCGRSAGSPRDEARARRAPRDENETATTVRSRSRRPSAVSVQRSLGQLREVERAASWPRRQPRQARSAQRQVLCGRSAGSPRDEARARRAPRDENETATTVRSRSRRPSAVSVQRSLGQLREVERAASWPRRQPRQARSAQRQVLCGRSAGSPRDEARARCAPRDENETATTVRSRSRRPSAVSVQRSLGQLREVERAASWPRRQPRQARSAQRSWPRRQPRQARSAQSSVGGRLVLHVTKRARAARHGTRTRRQRRFEAVAADRARCRCRGASANCVRWSAPRVGRADNRAKHAARRDKCSVGGRLVLHVTKRARAARHGTRTRRQRRFEAVAADRARCRCRGASANCVRWSAPRVGRADNRAKHAARRDKCSVGGRLVLHVTKRARVARHGTRTRRQRRFEAVAADRARCRCRGASANYVRWSAPRVGREDNRAKHAARRDKCSVGGRLVLHVTKRARAARHGTRTRRQRRFEAVAADRARCRCRGASANCVRWSAPRVGRADNRAKHAARRDKCSVGGRLVLHVTKRARAARHGTRTRRQRRFEAVAADRARCRCRGASANCVRWSAPRVGRADNRAKHAARRDKCSVGGRLVFHVTKRARAARHGTRTRRQRRFEAVAADRARCRCRGASANCVRWSAPRVGRADNRAKHAARRDKCSVGGRLVLHVTKRARAARHGTRTRRQRRFEAVAADRARCRCRGASANCVRWSAPRVGRADNRAKHAARRDKCSVGGRLVLHVTKRARAARHGTRTRRQRRFEAVAADRARCRCRGASANCVRWSAPRVGRADNRAKHAARRGVGRADNRAKHAARRALWAVGWFST